MIQMKQITTNILKSILVILITFSGFGTFAQNYNHLPGAPGMLYSDITRKGVPYAKDPQVIKFKGKYLMYYSLPGGKDTKSPISGWAIGIAESKDMIDWQKVGEVLPEQECEKNGLAAPSAIVLKGKVHLFYQSYGNWIYDAMCHAWSEDGIHFTRNETNPIF